MNDRNNWQSTTLGKALPIRYGKARASNAGVAREDTPVYGSSGVIDKFNRALTTGPALVVGRKGTVGATYYSAEPCWPIDTVYFAEASEDKDLRFFKYLLDHLQLGRMDRSTAVPGLSRDDYNAKEVAIPDIDEQRRIVAEIEKQFTRLEAGVVALRRVQANLKRYRAAVLKAACEGRLVPTEAELAKAENRKFETGEELLALILTERRQNWQGRGKCKEPAAPNTADLPPLPDAWTWATMPQLGELNRGKSKHRPRDDERLYGGPYPFIQTGDVRRSGGTIREHTQNYSEFGLQQSRLWPEGTLCITIAANIAETGILNFEACFPDSVVGFTQHRAPVVTRYVEFFVRTAKERLAQFAPATAQKNINLDVLQKVAVPLPPLAEQTRIVAEVERRLSVVEELEAMVSVNLQRATGLRQSILGRALFPSHASLR